MSVTVICPRRAVEIVQGQERRYLEAPLIKVLKSIEKCLATAEGEQRRLFLWMKAALQCPGLEQFMQEVKRAEDCRGTVSLESLHKAVDFAKTHNEFQIRGLAVSDDKKEEMVRLEKIRLDEVEVKVA